MKPRINPDYFSLAGSVLSVTPTEPDAERVVVRWIRRHQRPLIVCGGGVKYLQAEEALLRFAERRHLPTAGKTRAGKGAPVSAHIR